VNGNLVSGSLSSPLSEKSSESSVYSAPADDLSFSSFIVRK